MHPRSGSRLLFEHDDTDEPVILIDAVGSHRTLRNGTKRNSLAKQTGRRLGLEFSSFKNRVQIAGCSARGPARLVVLGFLRCRRGAGGCAGPDSGPGGGCSVGFFCLRIRKVAIARTAPTAAIIPIISSHGRPAVA